MPRPNSDSKAGETPGFYVRHVSYANHGGTPVDHGQLIHLLGGVNEEKLLRIGYIAPHDNSDPVVCGECGAMFISDMYRTMHGNKRHRPQVVWVDPASRDEADAKEFKRGDRLAPLHLENTTGDKAELKEAVNA